MSALAKIVEDAMAKAAQAAINMIRETPSWDFCDPHKEYYKIQGELLAPYVEEQVKKHPGLPETTQYLDGLITGREYLVAICKMAGQYPLRVMVEIKE